MMTWRRFVRMSAMLLDARICTSTMTYVSVGSSDECAECATNKVGKLSCCARGGAWFKKCGDFVDTQFDHTWAEGIQACKHFANSVLARAPPVVMPQRVGVIDYLRNTSRSRNITPQQTNIFRVISTSRIDATDSEEYLGCARVAVCISIYFFALGGIFSSVETSR